MSESMTGKRALLEMLKAEGVEYIFGNPGTSEGPIIDLLGIIRNSSTSCVYKRAWPWAWVSPMPGPPAQRLSSAFTLTADWPTVLR